MKTREERETKLSFLTSKNEVLGQRPTFERSKRRTHIDAHASGFLLLFSLVLFPHLVGSDSATLEH